MHKCNSTGRGVYRTEKEQKMSLTKVMREKGITTQRLSELTGINKRTLENYRTGHRKLSLETGLMIAKTLEADPYDLLEEKEPDPDEI